MRARQLRVVLLAMLVAGSVIIAASSARADGCEGNSCSGFVQDEYEVAETAGSVELQVSVAWCCPVAQGTIDYYTSDLTAVAGHDYQQTSGTLTYTGHGGNVIRVPITNDELVEGEERFEVKLTNFRGSFVNRGRETAVVRILGDYPKQSSGIAASPGRSGQQPVGSQESSLAPPPSLHPAGPDSSGSTDVGNQSGQLNPDDLTRPDESSAPDGAKPLVGKAVRGDNGPSSLPLAGLGTLLLVLTAAVGFALKKRRPEVDVKRVP